MDGFFKGIDGEVLDRDKVIDSHPELADLLSIGMKILVPIDELTGDGPIYIFIANLIALIFKLDPVQFPRTAGLRQFAQRLASLEDSEGAIDY